MNWTECEFWTVNSNSNEVYSYCAFYCCGDRGRIAKQSPVCFPVSIGRQERFQLRWRGLVDISNAAALLPLSAACSTLAVRRQRKPCHRHVLSNGSVHIMRSTVRKLQWTVPLLRTRVHRAVLTNGHTGHVPRAPGFFSFWGAPDWLWWNNFLKLIILLLMLLHDRTSSAYMVNLT